MSRIGRAPIEIPAGVTVTLGEDNLVKVKARKVNFPATFIRI